MARTAAGRRLTERHRVAQVELRSAVLAEFARLWPLWTGDRRSFEELLAAALPMIQQFHGISAELALAYFRSFRAAERAGGATVTRLAPRVDVERVKASLYITGIDMTRNALLAGQQPQQAMRTALVRTSGTVTRSVLQGGRDTLVLSTGADRKATGWARVTSSRPCAFCAMLASRGAVFLGEATAEFRAHDGCACGAEPAYEGAALPAGSDRWRQLYAQAQQEARAAGDSQRGTSNDALNNFRRHLAAEPQATPA